MKRIIVLLMTLALLTGCTPAQAPVGETYCTFTDSTGSAVTLSEKPATVAVLFSSFAEVWSLAGGRVDITVGETVERGFAAKDAVLVDSGAGKTVNTEALLAAQPDLVIGSADIPAQVDACEAMKRAGIPAALFRVDTFAEYLTMLRICTQITGNEDAWQRHGVEQERQIKDLLSRVQNHLDSGGEVKQILFVRAGSSAASTKAKRAPENFVCTMLRELGSHNIADEAPVLLDGLSLEHVMLRDPDYIFLSPMGDEGAAKAQIAELFSQEGWWELTAVQTENYSFLEKELFHFKPNARWAEAYRSLAELLYPEIDWYES